MALSKAKTHPTPDIIATFRLGIERTRLDLSIGGRFIPMRPLLKELVPWKESLTMENVFAPQAQQLQTAISPELSIAAEVCRA